MTNLDCDETDLTRTYEAMISRLLTWSAKNYVLCIVNVELSVDLGRAEYT